MISTIEPDAAHGFPFRKRVQIFLLLIYKMGIFDRFRPSSFAAMQNFVSLNKIASMVLSIFGVSGIMAMRDNLLPAGYAAMHETEQPVHPYRQEYQSYNDVPANDDLLKGAAAS